jgi:hypothetical protein
MTVSSVVAMRGVSVSPCSVSPCAPRLLLCCASSGSVSEIGRLLLLFFSSCIVVSENIGVWCLFGGPNQGLFLYGKLGPREPKKMFFFLLWPL